MQKQEKQSRLLKLDYDTRDALAVIEEFVVYEAELSRADIENLWELHRLFKRASEILKCLRGRKNY